MPARKAHIPVIDKSGKVRAVLMTRPSKVKGSGLRLAGNGKRSMRGRGGFSLGGLAGLQLPSVGW